MLRRTLGVIALGLIGTGVAAAQERAPHTGSVATSVDFGVFVPKESTLETAPIVNVSFEYYVRPRVSIRTGFGLTNPGFSRESTDSLRQVPLHFDVNYNWEGGKWHPFVGAGAGAYFLQPKDNGRSYGSSETKAGFDLGGGVEYFIGRTVSLKGEGRYHVIQRASTGDDPSGMAITGGLKKYW